MKVSIYCYVENEQLVIGMRSDNRFPGSMYDGEFEYFNYDNIPHIVGSEHDVLNLRVVCTEEGWDVYDENDDVYCSFENSEDADSCQFDISI